MPRLDSFWPAHWDDESLIFRAVSICASRGRGASEYAQVSGFMTDPATFDDTKNDHERLEAELLAQDRDAERIATADVSEKTARHLVRDLVETDVVTPVPEQRVLVHEPSGNAFDSITQLAVFHRGWTAACDASEEAE